jgi:hypothetical protein
VAAARHDHLFVSVEDVERALAALAALSERGAAGGASQPRMR